MGLFSKLKHAFHNIGHAIEHVAKDVAHGIEHVAKDIGNAAHEAANALNDIAHGRLRAALNDMASVGTNLAKGLTDVEKTAVDAAADATVDLHLSKAMDKMAASAKQMAAKMADNTVKAVDHIGHSLANSTATLASDAGHLTKDVVTGHLADVKHDLSKYGTDWGHAVGDLGKDAMEVVKTVAANAGEVGKCATDSAAAALEGMHISKSVDRFAEKASHTIDKGIHSAVKITDQVADGVASDVAGAVDGAVAMTKDIVSGQGSKLLHDGLNTAMSAAAAVGDLTPEGVAANVVMATMKAAHIGNEMVQNIVGGVIGGPEGLLKRVAQTGVVVGGSEALKKVPDSVREAVGKVTGDVGEALGKVTGGAGEALGKVTGGVGEVLGKVTGGAGEVLGKVTGGAGEALSKAADGHTGTDDHTETDLMMAGAFGGAAAGMMVARRGHHGATPTPVAPSPSEYGSHPYPGGPAPGYAHDPVSRDVTHDQTPSQSELHTRTDLQVSPANPASLTSSPVLREEEAAKPQDGAKEEEKKDKKDNGVADSAGNVAGAAGGVAGTASTLAGSAETAAAIAAAQASAAIAMAAQVAMAAIQNEIALNEARCHVSEEIGKGVKSLAQ